MDPGSLDSGVKSASLLSLPNEVLLVLLKEPGSLHLERQEQELTDEWYTWSTNSCTRYTRPWSTEHHPIALPLSQTCRRLRDLMLASVWAEVGLDSLEDLSKIRTGLRLLPERAELIVRLEWRWYLNHPAETDPEYRLEQPQVEGLSFCSEPLELLLQPPRRWSKQPLATEEECVEAMAEVICQLPNLDTLLWTSPYLTMSPRIADFIASKHVPLTAFQVDMGGVNRGFDLATVKATYWKFAGKLDKLSLQFRPVREERVWSEDAMARWSDYDDSLSGLDAFCAQWLQREQDAAKEAEEPALSEEQLAERLGLLTLSERQAVITYKTLVAACESNSLRSLAIDPHWVLSVPQLAHYWMKLEHFHLICERDSDDSYDLDWIKENAQLGRGVWDDETNDLMSHDWAHYAEWHLGAAAIRPAIYHAAHHRKKPGPLTVEDVQAIGKQGARYPASLFYPHFRSGIIAQRILDEWQKLVARGEGERVLCQCEECQ